MDVQRRLKEMLVSLVGSVQSPVENPATEDAYYGGYLTDTPDGPKVACLRLTFEDPHRGQTGVEAIAAERLRQIEQEGWTAENDDAYEDAQMVAAHLCCLDVRSADQVAHPRNPPFNKGALS